MRVRRLLCVRKLTKLSSLTRLGRYLSPMSSCCNTHSTLRQKKDRSYACSSLHTHHWHVAATTVCRLSTELCMYVNAHTSCTVYSSIPQEQLLRPLCQKALVVATICPKQVNNLGTNELKASYKQTGDAAPLPNMITVWQHSFDLASERENKAPIPSLSREATVLCMYVICS